MGRFLSQIVFIYLFFFQIVFNDCDFCKGKRPHIYVSKKGPVAADTCPTPLCALYVYILTRITFVTLGEKYN